MNKRASKAIRKKAQEQLKAEGLLPSKTVEKALKIRYKKFKGQI
jgi:hypothetical protein